MEGTPNKQNSKIKIFMLGRFDIIINGQRVNEQLNNSTKMRELLEYLILQKDKAVTYKELFDTLWPDDENENPVNALKTLLYRLRMQFTQSGADELRNCIITRRGSYQWNPSLDCEIDVFQLEKLCRELGDRSLPRPLKMKKYKEIVELYTGDLLPKSAGEPWSLPFTVYYHTIYMECVHGYLELLKEDKDFEKLVEAARLAINIDCFEEKLHIELMQGLIELGRKNDALKHYNYVRDLHQQQIGTAPPEAIQKLYRRIMDVDRTMELDIDKIQKELEEDSIQKGAFICDYEIFKDIYQIQVRYLERTGNPIFLALITVTSTYKDSMDPMMLDKIMDNLQEVMKSGLRKGDTIAKYSASQFVLLLPGTNYENSHNVMERLRRQYYKKYVDPSIVLDFKIKPLSYNEQ